MTSTSRSRSPAETVDGMQLTRLLRDQMPSDLALRGGSKDEILCRDWSTLLGMDERSAGTLLRMLQRRENLGSTGVGRGIAIPHCRSLVVSRLRLAFGHRPHGSRVPGDRRQAGLQLLSDRGASPRDLQPIPAGPGEDRSTGQGTRRSRSPGRHSASPDDFFRLLHEKGV